LNYRENLGSSKVRKYEYKKRSSPYWKNSPDGKILKRDIVIARNYLNEKELPKINRIVTMFIDYAEMQSEDEIVMSMQDWVVDYS